MSARSKMLVLAEIVGFAMLYFFAGKLGLFLAFVNASATAVWPPTGLALAFLLWRGRGYWPGIFIGAFLVNVSTQGSIPVAIGISGGNTLEAVAGAWLVCRFGDGIKSFETTRGAFRFILFAAILSTTFSATIGVTTLCLARFALWENYGPIWLTWWLGDMVSNVVVAPLLVAWLGRPMRRLMARDILEACALLLSIVLIGVLVFSRRSALSHGQLPVEFLALPPLIWAAFRFGVRGATGSAFVISGIALWGTLDGWGPFVRDNPNESLLLLQAFMGTASMTALALALVIAERRRAQEALVRHRDELEKLVQQRTAKLSEMVNELEGFSYSITHDMRAPLRAMQNFAALLEEECKDNLSASGKEYSRRIREASKRMDLLIQDSLAYNRVIREEMPLQAVDLSKLLRGLVETYPNLQAPEAEIDLEVDGVHVLGNQAGLIQCFSNLLGNAVKFVAPGVKPQVRVFAERRADRIRMWVIDNGIGIPALGTNKLFAMFQRLHRDSEYPGTGIGLAIVRKAAERMNGTVGFESDPGKGSRFWIELEAA